MKVSPKFSEEVVPISELKVNPDRVISQVDQTHRPVLLTSRGRGVAVMQGLMDVEAGRTLNLAEARQRPGLECAFRPAIHPPCNFQTS